MPLWLLEKEEYEPKGDKDGFLEKSIMGLLGVLARIKSQNLHVAGRYNINTTLKLGFTLLMVIMITSARSYEFTFFSLVYLFISLSFMKIENVIKILWISTLAAIFTLVIMLPSLFFGNNFSFIFITMKVFLTVLTVNILSYSSEIRAITASLKAFHIPDLFILVLDITIKYIVLLGEFSLNMLYALKLRSVGKNKSKNASLSGIAGTMFIKSKEMAEEMYSAMQCRCFTGEYKAFNKVKLNGIDAIYVAGNLGMGVIFLILGGLR